MKRITNISVCVCLALLSTFTACKKAEDVTPTPTPTTPTTPTTTTTSTPSPKVGSVDGVLVSLRVDMNTVTAGYPITLTTENAVASFFTSTGATTFVDAGTVSVNSINLEKQTNYTYYKTATTGMTPSDMGFNSTNSSWSVGGAGSVPAFNYDHNVPFPKFTGTIPETVTRSSGLSISVGGDISNADSIILFMVKDTVSLIRTFSGNATSISLSASDLTAFPAVTDKSAILEIVPYRVTMKAQGSKNYAFIKEYAAVRMVNIN